MTKSGLRRDAIAGLILGGVAGGLLSAAVAVVTTRWNGRRFERALDDLDHDVRRPLTVIRGEVELVLSRENVPDAQRERSAGVVIEQIEQAVNLLARRYG
ncbi:MAG: hypothetical protein U0821_24700 [Chloroflexota bacterium]